MHYAKPPLTKPFSIDAFHAAISWTFLHWGLHPWAIYTTLGLALCWAVYRCHLPLTIRSCLFGLFPKKYDAWVGNTIDICAVLGTLFGVAASLGLGVMQLNAGLSELFQVPQGISIQVMLIVGITLAATFSVLSGVGKGIKWLSNINIAIACVLFGLVFFSGPTQYLLGSFFPNLLQYLTTFIPLSLSTNSALVDWKADWTHFYLGWWIAWAPFVGLFIARISKGRTIREFIIGALLLPTLLTLIWIHVFGSFGLYLQHMKGIPIIEMMGGEAHQSLFILFKYTPWPHLLSGIAMLGLFTFFITSSDSGSLVVDIITAGGNPNPPKIQKIFWAGMEGLIAITLLMLGGLKALQAAAICTGLLFSLMLILVLWNLIRQFTNPNLHQEL
jgi:choline/glycine/proline betaine transport protein